MSSLLGVHISTDHDINVPRHSADNNNIDAFYDDNCCMGAIKDTTQDLVLCKNVN